MTDFYESPPASQAEKLEVLGGKALSQWDTPEHSAISLIKHRENAVFKIDSPAGKQYALRVHRHGYHSDDALRSELQWMTALNEMGIHTPDVISAKDGALFKVVECEGVPEPRQCDLFSWVDGELLGSVESAAEGFIEGQVATYKAVGTVAARVHRLTIQWPRPEGFIRHAWDKEGLLGENALWGRFWELEALTEEQSRLVLDAKAKILPILDAYGKTEENYGLIHADLLPENMLKKGDDLYLIDFDDAGFGYYLSEIATSLFFHLGQDHFDDVKNAFIEGYRSERELSDEELELLPVFFMIRGLVYLGWAHTRKETETAQAMTGMIVEGVTQMAQEFLS